MRVIKTMIGLAAISLASPALAGTVEIGVDGLVCAFCVKGIEKSFRKQDSVEDVKVDLDAKRVSVITKQGKVIGDDVIKQIVSDAGYNTTTIIHKD